MYSSVFVLVNINPDHQTTALELSAVVREISGSKIAVTRRHPTVEENISRLNGGNNVYQTRSADALASGTRLGRQELNAEILDDNPNALWKRDQLDKLRTAKMPEMARVVVAIDPSGTDGTPEAKEKAADVGIVVAGRGVDGRYYVLADRTCNLSPDGWGKRALIAYGEFKADRIVAEKNFGGAMVKYVIRTQDPDVPFKDVTASRGKWVRAEPVAALYEQGRVIHVGSFPELEDEMCSFGPDGLADERSPNRVDAMVWAALIWRTGGSTARDYCDSSESLFKRVKMKGKVKWYDKNKGYGFIVPEDGTRDIFMHAREINKCMINPGTVMPDVHMEFVRNDGENGPFATDLKLA